MHDVFECPAVADLQHLEGIPSWNQWSLLGPVGPNSLTSAYMQPKISSSLAGAYLWYLRRFEATSQRHRCSWELSAGLLFWGALVKTCRDWRSCVSSKQLWLEHAELASLALELLVGTICHAVSSARP